MSRLLPEVVPAAGMWPVPSQLSKYLLMMLNVEMAKARALLNRAGREVEEGKGRKVRQGGRRWKERELNQRVPTYDLWLWRAGCVACPVTCLSKQDTSPNAGRQPERPPAQEVLWPDTLDPIHHHWALDASASSTSPSSKANPFIQPVGQSVNNLDQVGVCHRRGPMAQRSQTQLLSSATQSPGVGELCTQTVIRPGSKCPGGVTIGAGDTQRLSVPSEGMGRPPKDSMVDSLSPTL